MVPAPQAALFVAEIVAEIVAESRQNRQIVAEMLARSCRCCSEGMLLGMSSSRVQHVNDGKIHELA